MKNKIALIIVIAIFSLGKSNAQARKKFSDPLNTAVFTTKYVLNDKKEITYVSHDAKDGTWQFFSGDQFERFEEVAKIISLGQVLKIDKSLYDLADMPLGYVATRKNVRSKWKIEKQR